MQSAIFLDRDGVICRNRDDYVKSWDEFVFIPGARQALAHLARSNLPIIVVTNQSIINRRIAPAGVVEEIHARMVGAVKAIGGHIDLVRYCPHRPDEGCNCRKPRPGMLLAAAKQLNLDLRRSYLVGDARSDVQAGQAVGCQCYLVLTGRGRRELKDCRDEACTGFRVVADLETAVYCIMREQKHVAERLALPVPGKEWSLRRQDD